MMHAHRLLMVLALAGCATARPNVPASPPSGAPPPPQAAAGPVLGPSGAAIDSLLAGLSARQKVAQVVMPRLPGNYSALDDSAYVVAQRWVDSLELGGFVVFAGSPLDVAAKVNVLQRRSRLPLLVSADLEWGAGMRLLGATVFPPLMAVGATGDPKDAYTIGEAAAVEGRAVGIHVNFAPDADLNNNPLNPIINTRSFGEAPRAVAKLVQAYVRGLRDHGMLATLKHFPGHGDTQSDSHIGLPVITARYAQLDTLELVPFRAGIDAGADVVMSAHIAFPALTGDSGPATLSAAAMTGLLRDSLRFRGVVVTDALDMGAIVTKYGSGEATVRAFLAGADLLLIPADPDSAVNAMTAAVASGRVSRERLDASVRRVLEIKRRLGLFERRTMPLDSIMRVVGAKRAQDAANDLAVRALMLVRDTTGILRALRARRSRIALIAYSDEGTGSTGFTFADVLRRNGDTVDYFRLWPMSGPASYDSARTVLAHSPTAVFASNVKPISSRGNIALPDSLARLIIATDSVKPTVMISFGSPYLLSQAPTVKTYLLAWSGARACERAAARALLGYSPITGHLPIRIPPGYGLGFGIVIPDSAVPPLSPPVAQP